MSDALMTVCAGRLRKLRELLLYPAQASPRSAIFHRTEPLPLSTFTKSQAKVQEERVIFDGQAFPTTFRTFHSIRHTSCILLAVH
ncbi:hypothetical protein KIN20_028927 [Parelaphostrongylus tenuis]|uniref:Uncharacterized protein n=1 Tax=Parelaphostrongylus tenuis TaxID=148309 RepID=A0AAD5R1L7_PARTN|nr:hypothetical protein KIN20_028927 [Parelaphostrongylus tenuis]